MKYETWNDEKGVTLKLGLNHSVTFEPGVHIEDVVQGIEQLIQTVVGVSAFELAMAVVEEFNKMEEATAANDG